MVSNPTCEDFFDNCAYHNQKSLNNLAISKKGLFIMHLSVRSLQKFFDSLAHYLLEVERLQDVIAIAESKITKIVLYLNINLHGYSFLHCDSETKAGGVTFYIKESFSLAEGII